MNIIIDTFAVASGSGILGVASGWLLRGRRKSKGRKNMTGRDEYLRWDGREFVPMEPPQFVAEGVHPTVAARQRTRADGIQYATRRVE